VAAKRLELFVQVGQNGGREHIDLPQQVVPRNHLVEAKLAKELPLMSVLPPDSPAASEGRNHCSLVSSGLF
jgi:hypothetical protein